MNCGDIEENLGVLDQCYSNNNFVTNAVLGVFYYLVRSLDIEEKTYFITLIVICHSALPRNRFTCAI